MAQKDPEVILGMVNRGVPLRRIELQRLLNASGVKIGYRRLIQLEESAMEKLSVLRELIRENVPDRGPVVGRRLRRVMRPANCE